VKISLHLVAGGYIIGSLRNIVAVLIVT